MSRAAEIFGFGLLAGECQDGLRAVVSRNSGGAAVREQINGNRKRRGVNGSVVGDHHRQFQFLGALNGNGGANQPARMRFHKVYLFRRDAFGSDNKVAFVFTIFIVNHNDKVSVFYFLDSLFYRVKRKFFHFIFFYTAILRC